MDWEKILDIDRYIDRFQVYVYTQRYLYLNFLKIYLKFQRYIYTQNFLPRIYSRSVTKIQITQLLKEKKLDKRFK